MIEQWYKSSYSKASGECVEAVQFASGDRGVRDSQQPELGHLAFASGGWNVFISSVKAPHTG